MTGITGAYSLKRRVVTPGQLLLDPANPRLLQDAVDADYYSLADIMSREVQEWITEKVLQTEHQVQRLIESISEMGFIGGLHEMIVKKAGPNSYLVLEGNRRTAALQYLTANPQGLSQEVVASIGQVEVQEFVFQPGAGRTEQEVIDIILGTIHIDGPQEWGALEKAQYILRNYARAVGKPPFSPRLRYEASKATEVGLNFNMKPAAVKGCLAVSRVYQQLRDAYDSNVQPAQYTLIPLAVKTRAVAKPYFELSPISLQLSDRGIERFGNLCLPNVGRRPIHNPQLFRQFVEVVKNGAGHEASMVRSGTWTVAEAIQQVRIRSENRAFLVALDDIYDRIGRLRPGDFRGTVPERQKIEKIARLVHQRLLTLID